MINDTEILAEIRANWQGVELLRGKIQRSFFASASSGVAPMFLADAANNLPFLHALSVFNDYLEALAKEGGIKCKSRFLGELIKAAKKELIWVDFITINEAVIRRNDLAHRGDILTRGDCWRYIDAVKMEFVAWGIVSTSQ